MTIAKRILVCGARDYPNEEKVHRTLAAMLAMFPVPFILINGKCPTGADLYADEWGKKNLPEENLLRFPAQWKKYGRPAGPIRNQQMLDEGKPDMVFAFGGLNGTGTNDMVRRSRKADIPVVEFDRGES